MLTNLIIILVLILVVFGFSYYYYKKSFAEISDEDLDEEFSYDIKDITTKVAEAFATMLKQDLREINLSKEELELREKNKAIIRVSLKESAYGNLTAKATVKAYIKDIVQEPQFGINATTINRIIRFDKPNELTSQDKFEILLYIYSKKLNQGKQGFSNMVYEFEFDKPIYINGEESYDITKERIDIAYEVVSEVPQCQLDYNDKLEIVTQRIFQSYKGFGVADLLFETDVDEIDAGVSGISMDTFDIRSYSEDIEYSYEAIWVLFHGKNIRLSCLSFGKQEELIRVCQNIYKFNAPKTLSKKDGYVVSTMKDGSRIVVARPPFANSWMFFARKFDSVASVDPYELVKHENAVIPITMMKWLIKGQRNIAITGSQGTGKSTFLKSLIRFIDSLFNIRIQELASELNLNYAYPRRNIVGFQETDYINAQEGLNLQKKTNGTVNIIGEVATAEQASHIVQTATVASLFAMFTHHAKTARDLVIAIRNNLLETGGYSNEKSAEEMASKVLMIDCHLVNIKGNRYIERITEIIPITDRSYPTDNEPTMDFSENTLEYYKRSTDRELFTTVNLVEWHDGKFVLTNMPSPEMMADIKSRLTDEEEAEFEADMQMIMDVSRGVS